MAQAAARSLSTAIKDGFNATMQYAAAQQRDINRSLLPQIQQRMQKGYANAMETEKGAGRFNRIKNAVQTHTEKSMGSMFSTATTTLLKQIDALIRDLEKKVLGVFEQVVQALETVYSACWEGAGQVQVDPAHLLKVRECRDGLLPAFAQMRTSMDEIMLSIGIERAAPDIDVLGIVGPDERLAAAVAGGEVLDLCGGDSPEEEEEEEEEDDDDDDDDEVELVKDEEEDAAEGISASSAPPAGGREVTMI